MRGTKWVIALLLHTPALPAQEKAPPGPGRMEGIVLDATGQPLANTEVWLVNEDAPHAHADANGRFEFSRLSVGYHNVRALVRGWNRGTANARITHDAPFQYIHVVLLPAADVEVCVVDSKGAPIVGAEVVASRTASPGHYWLEKNERAVTGADGVVRLPDLALGETAFNAWAPGFGLGTLVGRVGEAERFEVKLLPTEALRLSLSLQGANAQQLARARWMLYAIREGYGAGCTLPPSLCGGTFGADGNAVVTGLPLDMGLRQIGVTLDDAAVTPAGISLEPATQTKQLAQDLEFQVVPVVGHSVAGLVLDPQGKPLPGLRLLCRSFQASSARDQEIRTDAQGRFHAASVTGDGGTFRLTSLDPHWAIDQPKDREFDELRERRCFVGKLPADAQCEVKCVAAAEVRGRVVDAQGRGVAGAEVELTAPWDNGRALPIAWTNSDRDGLFVLPRVNSSRTVEFWVQVHSRDGDARSAAFPLVPGQAVQLPPLQVQPPAVVTGVVRDANGKPVVGASVRLLHQQEGDDADATISDRDGHFRLVAGAGAYRFVCHRGAEKDAYHNNENLELKSGERLVHDAVCR